MINDGDVFRWAYKDEKADDRRQYSRYHCKSRIAIAENGWLIDTFWGRRGDGSAAWPYAEAETALVLERLGNMAELERRPEYAAAYYDDADCVDLNHSNSSRDNFYIRKGAVRSKEKMRAVVLERMTDTERSIGAAERKLSLLRERLHNIDSGVPLDDIYL